MDKPFLTEAEFRKFEYEGAEKLSPIEYARFRDMAPQMVYYYIRQGVIEVEVCVCGRKVVSVEDTDKALRARKAEKKRRS